MLQLAQEAAPTTPSGAERCQDTDVTAAQRGRFICRLRVNGQKSARAIDPARHE